jgi:hypothetical protein
MPGSTRSEISLSRRLTHDFNLTLGLDFNALLAFGDTGLGGLSQQVRENIHSSFANPRGSGLGAVADVNVAGTVSRIAVKLLS